MREDKKFFTTHEAAKLLYVTPTTVIQWIKDGKINVIRTIGGHRRILRNEIKRFIEDNNMYMEDGSGGKTVLIIEDDAEKGENLKSIFEENQIKAHVVKDAFEGGVAFEKNQSDLVICDMKIGQKNASSIFQYIKKNNGIKETKIVALTEQGSNNDVKNIIKLGVDKCIENKTDNEQIRTQIKELLLMIES